MKFNQNTSCAKLLCAKCQFSLYDCRFLQIIKSCLCVFLYYLINKKSLFSRCKSNSIPREISNKQWPTCVQYSTSRQEIVFSEECKNDGCNKIHCLCKAGTLFFKNIGSPKIISFSGFPKGWDVQLSFGLLSHLSCDKINSKIPGLISLSNSW